MNVFQFETLCYLVTTYHALISTICIFFFFHNIVINVMYLYHQMMETVIRDSKLESACFARALASPAQELQRILNARAIDDALSRKGRPLVPLGQLYVPPPLPSPPAPRFFSLSSSLDDDSSPLTETRQCRRVL